MALYKFDSEVQALVEFQPLETGSQKLKNTANELQAQGGTSLYDALSFGLREIRKEEDKDVIKALVVLSDGQDTSSKQSNLRTVVKEIEEAQSTTSPVLVIPIAYGADADLNSLNAISRASKTTSQTGDTDNIQKLLEDISSYF